MAAGILDPRLNRPNRRLEKVVLLDLDTISETVYSPGPFSTLPLSDRCDTSFPVGVITNGPGVGSVSPCGVLHTG